MKLCANCKYGPVSVLLPLLGSAHTIMCTHPKAPVDPVYGRKDATCALMRSSNCTIDSCGPDGNWFEQMPPKPVFEPKPYEILKVQEPKQDPKPKNKFWRIFG
jgi:hypothetical protein